MPGHSSPLLKYVHSFFHAEIIIGLLQCVAAIPGAGYTMVSKEPKFLFLSHICSHSSTKQMFNTKARKNGATKKKKNEAGKRQGMIVG